MHGLKQCLQRFQVLHSELAGARSATEASCDLDLWGKHSVLLSSKPVTRQASNNELKGVPVVERLATGGKSAAKEVYASVPTD